MLGHFLLLPNEVSHEVSQQLRTRAVTLLGCRCELIFQAFIDAEGESRFTHGLIPLCYTVTPC
jgi:hypothetical protein